MTLGLLSFLCSCLRPGGVLWAGKFSINPSGWSHSSSWQSIAARALSSWTRCAPSAASGLICLEQTLIAPLCISLPSLLQSHCCILLLHFQIDIFFCMGCPCTGMSTGYACTKLPDETLWQCNVWAHGFLCIPYQDPGIGACEHSALML